jgi:hypothetical protein
MAVLGVGLTGLLTAAATAGLFANLVQDCRWPRLVAVLGALFAAGDVLSGRTTFALGLTAGLATVTLRGRRRPAVIAAVVTALLSPVAAALVGLVAAVLVLHRRPNGWHIGIAAAVPVIILALLFPSGGVEPYTFQDAWPLVVIALAVAWLTALPMIRTGALLYAFVGLVLPVVANPVGANVLRLALLFAAPLLLATSKRPLWLLLVVSLPILRWQVDPVLLDLSASAPPDYAAVTQELVDLHSVRTEVVAARDHGEASSMVSSFSLARGWVRQVDESQNQLFYSGRLTPESYVAWLQRNGVDHVALPLHVSYDFGSAGEATLLGGAPIKGLDPVWTNGSWIVFAVRSPTPVVQAPARITKADRTALVMESPRAAQVDVIVRWSPWLSVSGPGCVVQRGDLTAVRFSGPGVVTLSSSLRPVGHCHT